MPPAALACASASSVALRSIGIPAAAGPLRSMWVPMVMASALIPAARAGRRLPPRASAAALVASI